MASIIRLFFSTHIACSHCSIPYKGNLKGNITSKRLGVKQLYGFRLKFLVIQLWWIIRFIMLIFMLIKDISLFYMAIWPCRISSVFIPTDRNSNNGATEWTKNIDYFGGRSEKKKKKESRIFVKDICIYSRTFDV